MVRNNIIWGNSGIRGGGIADCDGVIENNLILGNGATQWGGGIFWSIAVVRDNVIVGNSAPQGGAVAHSNVIFRNNVVVGNTAVSNGGGLCYLGTSSYVPPGGSIANCIIWGNSFPTGPQVYDSLTPTYSCIQDWTEGREGNTASDPRFVDLDGPDDDPNTFEDNDYRLLPNSPCIDKGVNEDWMATALDLDGNPRILLGATSLIVDMGPYEYRFDLAIGRNIESNLELSWTMRPQKRYTILSSSDITAQPWVEETTILGGKAGGPASWVDAGVTSALKFYRIEIK